MKKNAVCKTVCIFVKKVLFCWEKDEFCANKGEFLLEKECIFLLKDLNFLADNFTGKKGQNCFDDAILYPVRLQVNKLCKEASQVNLA